MDTSFLVGLTVREHPEHSACLRVFEQEIALFLNWMHEHKLGRKRLLDTLLAASLHAAGVVRLATTDWRDFRIFGVFEIVRL